MKLLSSLEDANANGATWTRADTCNMRSLYRAAASHASGDEKRPPSRLGQFRTSGRARGSRHLALMSLGWTDKDGRARRTSSSGNELLPKRCACRLIRAWVWDRRDRLRHIPNQTCKRTRIVDEPGGSNRQPRHRGQVEQTRRSLRDPFANRMCPILSSHRRSLGWVSPQMKPRAYLRIDLRIN